MVSLRSVFSELWDLVGFIYIWVRSRRYACLVTWFCYQMIAKPGNKSAALSWLNPYHSDLDVSGLREYLVIPRHADLPFKNWDGQRTRSRFYIFTFHVYWLSTQSIWFFIEGVLRPLDIFVDLNKLCLLIADTVIYMIYHSANWPMAQVMGCRISCANSLIFW